MKHLLLLLACLSFVGCDFTVPLVDIAALDLDKAVLGVWEKPKPEGGPGERLLVLPLDKHEYLVAFTGNGTDCIYARGCLCKAVDLTKIIEANKASPALFRAAMVFTKAKH